MMRKLTASLIAVFALACVSRAQISCSNDSYSTLTSYTNGMPNDSLFFICTGQTATLVATPPSGTPGWDFVWQQFNVSGNSWNALATVSGVPISEQSNLQPGGYRVIITDGTNTIVGTYIVWVCRINVTPSVNVNAIAAGCGSVQLTGQINAGSITNYYNPPTLITDPNNALIVNDQTQISVCFTGTHTFFSDLGFYLVGPSNCGSPTILLSPNPGTNCNAGNNFVNLCFSSESTTILNQCTAAVPVSGSYGGYGTGAGTMINWAALNGCDASQSGWTVQVYDCVGGDVGALTDATITFNGTTVGGAQTTFTYTTPAGFSSTIADNSCSPSTASIYTVPSAPAVSITFPTTYQWTANPPFNIPNSTSGLNKTLNPGPTVDTQFTLSLTGTHPGAVCGGTSADTEFFDYIEPDQPTISPVAPTYCTLDAAFNLAVDMSGGTWSGTGITSAANGTFDPSTAGAGSHTITYTVPGNCILPASVTINVTDEAQVNITAVNAICDNAEAFNLSATPGGGTWNGPGITDTNAGTFDPAVAGDGSHTITYNIGGTCPADGSTSIEVTEFIQPEITAPSDMCINESAITLTATPSGGAWTGPSVNNDGVFDPSAAGIGNHSITYTIAGNCEQIDEVVINVNDQSDVNIVTVDPMCSNEGSITLSASPAGGSWSGTGITNATNGTFNPAIAGGGSHTITYSITSGCPANGSIVVEVTEFTQPVITAPSNACVNENAITLTASPSGGEWEGPAISSEGIFDPSAAGLGSHTITYNVTGTCEQADEVTITVISETTVNIQAVNAMCTNSNTITLSASLSGGVWSGPGITNANTGTFNPATAGVGTHTINYLIAGVCPASGTTSIVVNEFVQPIITAPEALCVEANPNALTATPAGGTWSGNGVNAAGLFTPSTAGVGNANITYSIAGQCPGSTTSTIVINPMPSTNVGNNVAICNGENVTLTATGADSYSWSPSTGLSANNVATVTASPTVTTTYTVTGTTNACSFADQIVVTVYPPTNVVVNGPFVICQGDTVELSMTGLTNFTWNNTATLIEPTTTTPSAFPFNETTYTVSGTDANGCEGSASINVEVINVSFEYSPEEGLAPLIVEFTNLSEGNQFIWDFGNGDTEITTDPDVVLTSIYEEEGLFPVTLTVVTGTMNCSVTHDVFVYAASEIILMPNIVTADGSGKNDTFKIDTKGMSTLDVEIFDRWGKKVGTIGNPSDSWNPRDYPDGTYFFTLKAKGLDGKEFEHGGNFMVVR